MAKITISDLQTFVRAYVATASQAGAWSATTDNLLGLIDKIGKQVTLQGNYQDKLPELDGDDLPYGKTIEEWFIDLIMPKDFDEDGASTLAPSYPSFETPYYNYDLGKKTIKTTRPYDRIEKGAIDGSSASAMVASIMESLANSTSLYTYSVKKQLLGNMIGKAMSRKAVLAIPTDTATGEAFIKAVKADVEIASFASESTSIGGQLIGAAPSLKLYVKKGVMPSIEVDTQAGAFNLDKIAIPCEVKVIDDFGSADSSIYALLVDPRGVKLHTGYRALRSQENAEGDFVNFDQHLRFTGFISPNVFVRYYATK